jgi:hypothetical protein
MSLFLVNYFASKSSAEILTMTIISECESCVSNVGFDFIEVTAWTDIADLTQYSVLQYFRGITTPYASYTFAPTTGQQVTNIPAGTRIYVVGGGASANAIETFFDFAINENNLFVASLADLAFDGGQNFALSYAQGTIVDAIMAAMMALISKMDGWHACMDQHQQASNQPTGIFRAMPKWGWVISLQQMQAQCTQFSSAHISASPLRERRHLRFCPRRRPQ